jgi:hypothetical protein
MRPNEPSDTIHSLTFIHLACLGRQTTRDFAGYSIGKRRNLASLNRIALDLARRLVWPLRFYSGDHEVSKGDLARDIEMVLRSMPDGTAFVLASKIDDEVFEPSPVRASGTIGMPRMTLTRRKPDRCSSFLEMAIAFSSKATFKRSLVFEVRRACVLPSR